jgi:hypothetical protein
MDSVEIPEDIRELAWNMVCRQSCIAVRCATQKDCRCFNALASAIAEERARCARIAADWEVPAEERSQYAHGDHYIAGLDDAGERISPTGDAGLDGLSSEGFVRKMRSEWR